MERATIGIIGGSGLYQLPGLTDVTETTVATPFGSPSDSYTLGTLAGTRLAFLPRHGRGHRVSPSEINYRANIWGFKSLGVDYLISVSAVGSMKEEIPPGDIVLVDQFFDRTKGRPSTFFSDGIVAHVGFADPVCPELVSTLHDTITRLGHRVHRGGTYLCMEGPQFSTRAESRIYRSWGVDVIGMTNLPEAKLAREAEICYATLAMSTDFDCWHESEEDVTIELVIATLLANVEKAKGVIAAAVPAIARQRTCACSTALANAIITSPELITAETRRRLAPIAGRYLGE
jgi:5'-methylthioadenosine phosphorylase